MFQQPTQSSGGGRFFKPGDHDGHLVLITKVHSINNEYDDFRKDNVDVATVDIVDLTEGGNLRQGVRTNHKGIVNRLSAGAENVLGRVGKEPTKSGYQAWVLQPYAVEDAKQAQAWVEANLTPAAAPAAPAPVEEQAPWGTVQ